MCVCVFVSSCFVLLQVLVFLYPTMLMSCWTILTIRDRFMLFRSTWRSLCFLSRDIGNLTSGRFFFLFLFFAKLKPTEKALLCPNLTA